MRFKTRLGPKAMATVSTDQSRPMWQSQGRRIYCVLSVMLLIIAAVVFTTPAAMARTYTAMVIDAETGDVLHEYRADHKVYPASLTKIMTLYLTFDALKKGRLSLTTTLKVSRRAAGQTPSRLGLKRGQKITVRSAIRAVVTKSANDAATAIDVCERGAGRLALAAESALGRDERRAVGESRIVARAAVAAGI